MLLLTAAWRAGSGGGRRSAGSRLGPVELARLRLRVGAAAAAGAPVVGRVSLGLLHGVLLLRLPLRPLPLRRGEHARVAAVAAVVAAEAAVAPGRVGLRDCSPLRGCRPTVWVLRGWGQVDGGRQEVRLVLDEGIVRGLDAQAHARHGVHERLCGRDHVDDVCGARRADVHDGGAPKDRPRDAVCGHGEGLDDAHDVQLARLLALRAVLVDRGAVQHRRGDDVARAGDELRGL
mmetsp:Transcript_85800/g.251223  ORF Transcript_85800/g.251223 Transcript_85800/m.251223 type:complete len:233 (+) Transcript_85800:131-829(+)